MRKTRLILLGILCSGLLLCGIGAGVTLAEVSSFSYLSLIHISEPTRR